MTRFQSSVTNDPGCLWQLSRRRAAPRRGNTIVLVVGILALLVIIATAYISRTHAGRVTSSAHQRATLRNDNAQVIADSIAGEIAEALFVRPIAPGFGPGGAVPESNAPRLPIPPDALRYDFDPGFPANFAPFQVVAFTNWPDGDHDPLWPTGPGNPGPVVVPLNSPLPAEGNSLGNPGFGDTRWLADIEPQRWDTDIPADGILDAFSHWRHMTNIARPDNGWRIVGDISDVEILLVTDLSMPVEQQLAIRSDSFNGSTGLPSVPLSGMNFFDRWQNWFVSYATAYTDPLQIPPNFLDLKDLDGNGIRHDFFDLAGIAQDRPQDEFIRGTARWNVLRVLADTDGDGFTDSFWLLAPTMIERGIRQIVAFRIIDNSAMLNVNVATRFVRNDIDFPPGSKTRGWTATDLALVAEMNAIVPPVVPLDTWNAGFFDNPANWEDYFPGLGGLSPDDPASPYGTSWVRWNPDRWNFNDGRSFLTEIGVEGNPNFPAAGPLNGAGNRLDYWRWSGLRPFSATGGLTPFTLADELELRMYSGQNNPWVLSRFERAVNTLITQNAFLHSTNDQFNNHIRVESSEYLDQLGNRELLFDSRRKVALFTGARNDLMPPWLWWPMDDVPQLIQDQGQPAIDNFVAQSRIKLDLRDPELGLGPVPPPGVLSFRDRLPLAMLRALTDGFDDQAETYSGSASSNAGKIQKLAAAMAANTLAYRDDDTEAPLEEAVALPEFPGVALPDDTVRYLGLERQPFLVEAFIGHVYETYVIPGDPDGFGYTNSQQRIILEDDDGGSSLQSTVVVVQIANPYDQAIILHDPSNPDLPRYEIELFDQMPISLQAIAEALGPDFYELPPARDDLPSTMILYSIDPTLAGAPNFGGQWLNFLDIELGDHPTGLGGTIIVNLQDPALAGAVPDPWDTDRDTYDDDGLEDEAIRLIRKYEPQGTPTSVVIDRIDDPITPGFLGEVHAQGNPPANKPPKYADLGVPPPGDFPNQPTHPTGGWRPTDQDRTHWVQWVRISRAWGNDANGDGLTNPLERNPRYIYAKTKQTTALDPSTIDPRPDYPDRIFSGTGSAEPGVSFSLANNPDSDPGDMNMPWMTLDHTPAGGVPAYARKPTFFDMNGGLVTGYPDKGFYQFRAALQMLQKDGDFEQVGELLNVWLFGHELEFTGTGDYVQTTRTFSEFMSDTGLAGSGTRVNRLGAGEVIGNSQLNSTDPQYLLDPLHAVPALPAGLRVLDAFVCDGIGVNSGGAGEFLNANHFGGKATPGLININTAPVEVMRALPHMTRMVHEANSPSDNLYVRIPEAIVQYRERFNGIPPTDPNYLLYSTGIPSGANYSDRAGDLRPERGLASIGELMLLTKLAQFVLPLPLLEPNENWRVDFAALRPAGLGPPGAGVESTQISTDVNNPEVGGVTQPDNVAKDVEEANLLFAGISNLITTRSDMFTVYFKVRSFRQNRVTGKWDATDPEYIVDDSRYVMLVDRSEVNRPTDKPKILYLEKLPK